MFRWTPVILMAETRHPHKISDKELYDYLSKKISALLNSNML